MSEFAFTPARVLARAARGRSMHHGQTSLPARCMPCPAPLDDRAGFSPSRDGSAAGRALQRRPTAGHTFAILWIEYRAPAFRSHVEAATWTRTKTFRAIYPLRELHSARRVAPRHGLDQRWRSATICSPLLITARRAVARCSITPFSPVRGNVPARRPCHPVRRERPPELCR